MATDHNGDNKLKDQAGIAWHAGNNSLVREILAQSQIAQDWFDKNKLGEAIETPEGLQRVVELARLYVDATKNLANSKLFPHAAIELLDQAISVVDAVYETSGVRESPVFKSERLRDQSKLAEGLVLLFVGKERDELIKKSIALNEEAGKVAPANEGDSGPVTARIEAALLRANYGIGEPDWDTALKDYQELQEIHKPDGKHPYEHRLATVGMWLATMGEKVDRDDVAKVGYEGFEKAIKSARERGKPLNLSIEWERTKMRLKRLKIKVFGLLSQYVNPKTKNDLYMRVMKWNKEEE